MKKRIVFYLTMSIVLSISLMGCGGCSTDVYYKDLIADYDKSFKSAMGMAAAKPSNKKVYCYYDYSIGVKDAMSLTGEVHIDLSNFLFGDQFDTKYYRIGASKELVRVDPTSPEGNFLNPDNYTDKGSRLGVAVEDAVKHPNSQSIFVTDFERVDDIKIKQLTPGIEKRHPINYEAWAQNDFKAWLDLGNQIDVFCFDYMRPDAWFDPKGPAMHNNLYTIVFTPKDLVQAKGTVLENLENLELGERYTFNLKDITVTTASKGPELGNANENLAPLDLIVNNPPSFEFYDFSADDLVEYIYDEAFTDKRIINSIALNNNTSHADIKFGLEAYDITENLVSLSDFNAPQEELITETDEETGVVDTISGGETKEYNFNKGKRVSNIFDYVYNEQTNVLGVKLVKDFVGAETTAVYRLDFVITEANYIGLNPDEKDDLKMKYKGATIDALKVSFDKSLKTVSDGLKGTIVHSIYIQITP